MHSKLTTSKPFYRSFSFEYFVVKLLRNLTISPFHATSKFVSLLEAMHVCGFFFWIENSNLLQTFSASLLWPSSWRVGYEKSNLALKPWVDVTQDQKAISFTSLDGLIWFIFFVFIAGSLESDNWSILAARNLFKDVGGEKNQDFVIIRCPIS